MCHHYWAYDDVSLRQRQHLRGVRLGRDPAIMAVPLVQVVEIHGDDAGHGRADHGVPAHVPHHDLPKGDGRVLLAMFGKMLIPAVIRG